MTKMCNNSSLPEIDAYIKNLTSSYTNKSNEASMVSASVIMFLLSGLFFNLNLFSRFSDVSAILDPKVRIFLSSALSIFLPVMSYLFSEAKNAEPGYATSVAVGQKDDLSLRADVILVWMLLIELLRKKVDEIVMRGYSSTVQRAGRVAWLGSLVFFNVRRPGRKAVFGILWILCAAKVVQRIALTEVGKRSYAYGKNARLITSYMSRMLLLGATHVDVEHAADVEYAADVEHAAVHHDGRGDALLERSQLVVMGEQDLIVEATADGYTLKEISDGDTVVTVGKIWRHGVTGLAQEERLKRLCLSFALFKLMRRRFEHLPVTKAETRECRDIIFSGIYNDKEDSADALFQMMNDEVNFLCEYYHSVIPVVFAGPFFFLANYFLLPLVVLGLCLMTIILCGNGDALFSFTSIKQDNFAIKSGVFNTFACLLEKAIVSPPAFFTAVDFSITFFLFAILLYEEIWEFIVFLLSNWFMVSLLCNYVARRPWRDSPTFGGIVRRILWVRSKMSHPVLGFKQFSVLNLRWPLVLGMPTMLAPLLWTVPVPKKAKHYIVKSLAAHIKQQEDGSGGPLGRLSNVKSALMTERREDLLPACGSESVAEVILTWHIATSLLEAECPCDGKSSSSSRVVATRLSKYCAYLVAFHPELLPDNQDKTERVFEAVKEELKRTLRCCNYYFSRRHTRVNMIKAVATATGWKDHKEVVHNGARLGNLLIGEATTTSRDAAVDLERTWKLLADVWTELMVYVAPSNDEERVTGHEKVLVQGGEFITLLWALTTHIGITRHDSS